MEFAILCNVFVEAPEGTRRGLLEAGIEEAMEANGQEISEYITGLLNSQREATDQEEAEARLVGAVAGELALWRPTMRKRSQEMREIMDSRALGRSSNEAAILMSRWATRTSSDVHP